MAAIVTEQTVHALEIVNEEEIAALIDVVFESILWQLGSEKEAPGTGKMPMTLEAWLGRQRPDVVEVHSPRDGIDLSRHRH